MYCQNKCFVRAYRFKMEPIKKAKKITIRFTAKNWVESAHKVQDLFHLKNDMIKSLKSKYKVEIERHDKKMKGLKKIHEEMINNLKEESEDKYESLQKAHEEMVEIMTKEFENKYSLLQIMHDDVVALRKLDQKRLEKKQEKYIQLRNNYNEVNYNNAEANTQILDLKKNNDVLKEESVDMNLKYNILLTRFDDLTQAHDKATAQLLSEQNKNIDLRVDIEKSNGKVLMINKIAQDLGEQVKSLTSRLNEMIEREHKSAKDIEQMSTAFQHMNSKLDLTERKLEKAVDTKDELNNQLNQIKILYETLKEQVS